MLMSQLCDRYLADHARFKKSWAGDRNIIDLHIRPALGHKPVASVRYAHVAKLHGQLRKTPYQANRVLSVLSIMFTLAERWEFDLPPKGNPCSAVKRYPEKRRRRYLLDNELKALISALEARFEKYPLEAGLLLLLLYTGARCGEIKAARWEDIHRTVIYLEDSKTGQREIYLTPQALSVLSRLPRARRHIIGPDINPRYTWASVLDDTGLKNLRIHDLRHCYASVGISARLSLPVIGGLLGHGSPKTTQGYAHLVSTMGEAAALEIGQRFESIVA